MSHSNLIDFKITGQDLKFCGENLKKPTCIVKLNDHKILCTDINHGIIEIDINNNTQKPYLLKNQHPNQDPNKKEQITSFVMKDDKSLLLAKLAKGTIEHVIGDQPNKILFNKINNKDLGRVNFMCSDQHGGFYVTISSRRENAAESLNAKSADGYLAHFDDKYEIKIVADNLGFPNEARLDAKGEYLYVAETSGKRISRFKILDNNNLGDRETYGPNDLGLGGHPDGICFDKQGNLWGTLVFGEKIYVITKDQKMHIIMDLSNNKKLKKLEDAFINKYISPEIEKEVANKIIPLPVSLTFAGEDNKTVFIGNSGSQLAYFRSPVAGLFS